LIRWRAFPTIGASLEQERSMPSRKTLSVLMALMIMMLVSVLVILSMQGGVDNYEPSTDNPEVVFGEACARCHGERGVGGDAEGPRLAGLGVPLEEVKRQLREGQGRMPSFPNIRGRALDNLAAHVNQLSIRGEDNARRTEP
jgi:cytochrome c553